MTSSEIVNRFIARIEEVNPHIQAIVYTMYDAARATARDVDRVIAEGLAESDEYCVERRPLLGVPFTVKEAFELNGMPNSSGLVARRSVCSNRSAPCVRHLIDAGAIPVAGTNCSELCMWFETSNRLYGRTCNPYDVRRIVGGSSGGEAAIVAAGGSPFGVAADVGGSIRMPAFFNGVFGHKASPGLVSNLGQWPAARENTVGRRLLASGPICHHAEDLPLLVHVMSRQWKYCDDDDNQLVNDETCCYDDHKIYYSGEADDQASAPININLTKDTVLSHLTVVSVEDDCGYWLTSSVDPNLKAAQLRLCDHLETVGARVRHVTFHRFKYAIPMWLEAMKDMHGPLFATLMGHDKGTINPFWEFLKWILQLSDHTLPAIGLALLEKLERMQPSRVAEKARQHLKRLRTELLALLDDHSVLLYPSHPLVAPRHNEPLFTPMNYAYTAVFNALGFPVTQCPLGLTKEGLPLGVQVVAAPARDHLTLAVAQEIERKFGGWHPPGHGLVDIN